jgi:hypothetical protein
VHDGNHRILSVSIDLAGSLLSDFEKILDDRIEDLRGRRHEALNPVYNESLMIEIETLRLVLSHVDRSKQE